MALIDHCFYLRSGWLWIIFIITDGLTNRYYLSWTELCAKSILISRKFKSPGERLVCITENNIAIQTGGFWETVKTPQTTHTTKVTEQVKLEREFDLTLHRCACGLCEEWNKQKIDEVDEGQGIVPEQASCRNKDTSTD